MTASTPSISAAGSAALPRSRPSRASHGRRASPTRRGAHPRWDFPASAGGVDIAARLIGQWLSERLGQQFIIENRPVGGTQYRDRSGRALAGGRLHAAPCQCGERHQRGALRTSKFRFSSPNDVVARSADIIRTPRVMVLWPSLVAAQERHRVHRLRQGQCGQGQRGLRGPRGPDHVGRAVPAAGRGRAEARPLSGGGAGAHRPGHRPGASHVRQPARGDRLHQGGQLRALAVTTPKRSEPLRTCRPWPSFMCRASSRVGGCRHRRTQEHTRRDHRQAQ